MNTSNDAMAKVKSAGSNPLKSIFYRPPFVGLIAFFVVLVVQALGHTVMIVMEDVWPGEAYVYESAFAMGLVGAIMLFYGMKSENEVTATWLGFWSGTFLWTGWVEFAFVWSGNYLNVPDLMDPNLAGEIATKAEYLVMMSSVGILGATLAYFYHAPPLKLAYRGLGEGAVAVSYGPLIAVGTYLVLRGSVSVEVLVASLPLGLAIMAFLWINEFPDRRSDALAGKRTLVVRLGSRRAAVGFAVLITVSHLLVVALPLVGLPWSCLLGLAGLPLAVAAARRVWRYGSEAEKPAAGFLVPAQGWTLLSFLLMSVGTGAGALVGS